MSFKTYDNQQICLSDNYLLASKRTQKTVLKSWAKNFSEIIFPAINEERFSVLYSDNPASRPNTPVNVIIGALSLKEMFTLTDDELLESILCDIRFQYALNTTSMEEQPFSDRTLSRFRERNFLYTMETGRDLVQEEMESLADVFVEFMGINPSVKRMDSLMVASSCKKMSRLEILYSCVANIVKTVKETGNEELLKGLERYLNPDDLNDTIYHRKNEEISGRLQKVIIDAVKLSGILGEAFFDMPEYQLMQRVLKEQTKSGPDGGIVAKDKKDISPSSLQNPSDPDATYRSKAGKDNKGYVGNLVETFDENGAIITSFDYQQNSHSDSDFCKETIEKLGPQGEKAILITDGAYSGTENEALASANNIELITTALTGKNPDIICAGFQINSEKQVIVKCPAGRKPYKTSYYSKTEMYRGSFNKKDCADCPFREQCGSKLQKKSAYVMISTKMVQRASYLAKLSTEEYKLLTRKRNGIEGLPSVLRRRYHVDQMPVRGLVRSKFWFAFKVMAINMKRVLKKASAQVKNVFETVKKIYYPVFKTSSCKLVDMAA